MDSGNDDVIDYSPLYEKFEKNKFVNTNPLAFQHPATVLITAGTGQGKSNLLLNVLTNPKIQMTYDEVYLCCPSLDEPCYQFLQQYFEKKRKTVFKQLKLINKSATLDDVPQIFYHISDPNNIPMPETTTVNIVNKKTTNSKAPTQPLAFGNPNPAFGADVAPIVLRNDAQQKLVIIDDFTGDKVANEKITKLCQKNRKVNTSLIILNHDLFKLETTLKRNLSNGYVCLFAASSKRMINQFAQDFALNISKEDFYKIFDYATKEPYCFLLIDLKTKDNKLKFRKRFKTLDLIKMVTDQKPKQPDNNQLIQYLTGLLEEST
jgi:hypothetical protein